jgi:hypothetical protein
MLPGPPLRLPSLNTLPQRLAHVRIFAYLQARILMSNSGRERPSRFYSKPLRFFWPLFPTLRPTRSASLARNGRHIRQSFEAPPTLACCN